MYECMEVCGLPYIKSDLNHSSLLDTPLNLQPSWAPDTYYTTDTHHNTSTKYSQGLSKACWKPCWLLLATLRPPAILLLCRFIPSCVTAVCRCCWETHVNPLEAFLECVVHITGGLTWMEVWRLPWEWAYEWVSWWGLLVLLFWEEQCQ